MQGPAAGQVSRKGLCTGVLQPCPRQPRLGSLGPTLALPAALPGQGPTRHPLPSVPGPGLAQGLEGAVASGPLPKGDGMAPQPQSRKTQTLGRVLLKPSPSSPRSPAVPLRPQGPARWSTLAFCLFRKLSCPFPRQGLRWPRPLPRTPFHAFIFQDSDPQVSNAASSQRPPRPLGCYRYRTITRFPASASLAPT